MAVGDALSFEHCTECKSRKAQRGCSPLHTEQTGNDRGVHSTNGNKATGCILYQTRVLCHRSTQSLIQRLGASFCTHSRQKVLISRLLTAFFIFYCLSSAIKSSVCRVRWLILPCTQQTETQRVFTQQTGTKLI